jgi:hypothetical protein
VRVHSHEGEPQDEERLGATPAPPQADLILQLQRSAGNAAVARQLLLRDGPAVKAKGIEKQFDDAIKNKFWNLLASLLDGNRDAGAKKLATLGIDQLRILDDAARRIGLADQWLRTEVKTKLKAKGLTDKQAEPGMAYGKVEAKETLNEKGDLTARPKKRFRYRVEVEFTPNEAAVKADEIAFVQTIRVVDNAGDNASPYGEKRMTSDHTKVDRLTGSAQGWYGMGDDEDGGVTMKPWTKGGDRTSAWMRDTPKSVEGDRDYTFETAVVCRKGPDAGKVYAIVTWGLTVDSDLVVTPKPRQIWNKPTEEFGAAVDLWNKQAKGPAADRNAPGQQTLPGLK